MDETNPGGTDDTSGVVHYGTDAKNLSETAKYTSGSIRLFLYGFRVRVEGLNPKSTYYLQGGLCR